MAVIVAQHRTILKTMYGDKTSKHERLNREPHQGLWITLLGITLIVGLLG